MLRGPLDPSLSAYNFFHADNYPVGDPKNQNFMEFRAERGDLTNYYCRELSKSGEMRVPSYVSDEKEIWRWHYEDARKVASQFHFLQILEFLSDYGHGPFEHIGWKFDDSRKNAARRKRVTVRRTELPPESRSKTAVEISIKPCLIGACAGREPPPRGWLQPKRGRLFTSTVRLL